jgi:hypothetical protein
MGDLFDREIPPDAGYTQVFAQALKSLFDLIGRGFEKWIFGDHGDLRAL